MRPASRTLSFAVALVVLAGAAGAAQRPVRLLAEAEDFSVQRGPWKTVPYGANYYASTFAITFLSRMACLGAPAQPAGGDAVATQAVEIPYESDYQVLARYEQPYRFSAEFTVEIHQKGKAVFRQTFGRLDDPKIWAFNRHERVPMQRYSWGGTDNVVWQTKGAAHLAQGPATIRLIAGRQLDGGKPRAMAAKRHVDVICLTNDTAGLATQKAKARYLELDGWLVQDGDLFVRFTNPKDGLGPCVPVIRPFAGGQHSPYWVHVRDWPTTYVLKSGRLVAEPMHRPKEGELVRQTLALTTGPRSRAVDARVLLPVLDPMPFIAIPAKARGAIRDAWKHVELPDDQHLAPGDTSGWAPMGQALDTLNNRIWFPAARYAGRGGGEVDLELEFAIPDGKGGLKPVRKARVKGKGGAISLIGFEIPGNVATRPVLRTQLEALQWLSAQVARFPKKGSAPKRLHVYGLMQFSGATSQDNPLGRLAAELSLALGDNTTTPMRGPWGERLGVPRRRTGIVHHWNPGSIDALKKRADTVEKQGRLADVGIVSYGDEIHIPPAKPDDAQFAAWLKKRGVAYDGEIKVATERDAPLYYYSRLWAIEAGIEHYAQGTRWLEGRIGKHVLTGANYSPHANYMVTDIQWVRPFKLRGMTMPWSEDYLAQIPEFSVQASGYLVSGFRCGAKYHKLPIMMYVMPHYPNNTPRDFRLSFYTCIAHGATKINYFCASPLATAYTENYIQTEGLPMWRAVHDATHEAGIFEDYVMDGTVRPARVGLLLSSVDEILSGDTKFKGAIHNAERKAIYFALRHAQVPVDFVTEDDVIDGLAKDYRLLYVTQQYLHSKAVRALRKWVASGNTLVALCGGGYLNELGKPNPETEALYGAKSKGITKDPAMTQILAKQDLPPAKPLDTATLGVKGKRAGPRVEVIAWKQALVPADGYVAGTFSDGKPAAVAREYGERVALLFAFLPGLAWQKSGLPLRPPDRSGVDDAYVHFLPTAMDPKLHKALVDEFLPDDFVRPVVCSEPLVETTCIDTAKPPRLAVPLMNYTGKPIARLTVTINALPRAKSVKSVVQGPLEPRFENGALLVDLPLDVADMLLIDR